MENSIIAVTRDELASLNRWIDALPCKPTERPSTNRAQFPQEGWSSRHENHASQNGWESRTSPEFAIRWFDRIRKKGLEIMEQSVRWLAQLGQSRKGDA